MQGIETRYLYAPARARRTACRDAPVQAGVGGFVHYGLRARGRSFTHALGGPRSSPVWGAQPPHRGGVRRVGGECIRGPVIRAMGRWDSDVYELYLRYSLSCARQMGSVIASTSFEDFEAMFDHEEFVRP